MTDARATRPASLGLVVALSLFAIALGYALFPLRHLQRGWNDFAFIYAGGRAWLHGLSPYDVEAFRAQWSAVTPSYFGGVAPRPQTFMYPPHFALLAVPLSLLPWTAAVRVWDAMSLLAYAGIIALSLRLVSWGRPRRPADPWWWALVAIATANAAVRWSLDAGQMPILPLLGVVGTFWALAERRRAWLAVFAFLAALKPQLGLLPLLYVAVNGGLAGIVGAAAAALVVSGVAMAPTPLALFPSQLANCFRLHQMIIWNAPDYVFGVSALWAPFDPERRLVLLTPLLAIAFTVWLTRARRAGGSALAAALGDPPKQAAIVLAGTAALMPLHGYDLVVLSPLMLLCYEMRPRWLVLAIGALVQIVSRQSILSRLPLHPAGPWLTLALACLTFAGFVSRRAPKPSVVEA